jgi:glycosyltransferase involved in cell wall biosynthesis
MKIVMVNSFFPPWRGGAETYAFNLARALVSKGHEVAVQCGNDPLPAGTQNMFGIRIIRHKVLTRLYGTPIMPSLLSELRNAKADILHGNFPSPYIAFAVALTSKQRSIPAVLTWHNDLPPVTSAARFLIETHDQIVLPRYISAYRRIISTSGDYVSRSHILNKYKNRLRIVPNGVDCSKFTPSTNGAGLREKLNLTDKFTILFVGALTQWHRYKGLEVLLNAVKLALRETNRLSLLVVGEGELRAHYSSLSCRIGVDACTVFAGNVDDIELPAYYSACDVLVLPSLDNSEGFGLTLLEANATGKPVIASNVGGIPSVVRHGYNGLLVPPNDPKALSEAILTLSRDPKRSREMGQNGRRVAEAHDWKRTAANTERVYEEALA